MHDRKQISMELKGKTAIVTGGGRGIGEGISLALAREGANVVVMDRGVEDAKRVAANIASSGGMAIPFKADVTKKSEVQATVAAALKEFSALDILVNNAGVEAPPTLLQDISEEQWDRVLGVNVKGVFLCTQAVVPTMVKQKNGRIINIGSIASVRMTFFGSVDYTASKHALSGITKHLAWELADSHITVNAVCPGGVLTPGLEAASTQEARNTLTERLIPLGRLCSPDDIAQAVVFLAGERSELITGQILAVDGGLLTGYGEDLRGVIRKRMEEAKTKRAIHVA